MYNDGTSSLTEDGDFVIQQLLNLPNVFKAFACRWMLNSKEYSHSSSQRTEATSPRWEVVFSMQDRGSCPSLWAMPRHPYAQQAVAPLPDKIWTLSSQTIPITADKARSSLTTHVWAPVPKTGSSSL